MINNLLPEPEKFIDIKNNHILLRYFQNLQSQFMFVNNFGLALDDEDKINHNECYLRNLFVPPHLSETHYYPEHVIAKEIEGETENWLDVAEVLQKHKHLFILGDPGSGKSTLLSWLVLALSYSGNNTTKMLIGEKVPFLLVLRDLPLSQIRDWNTLWHLFLENDIHKITEPLKKDPDLINKIFKSGQALLLIDGLDEVTQTSSRELLGQAVLEGMHYFPECTFVITSRILGFNQREWFETDRIETSIMKKNSSITVQLPDVLPTFYNLLINEKEANLPIFYLSPFDIQQTHQFINNWYKQYQSKDNLLPNRIVELKQCITQNNGIGHLSRIPVLLNMICFIHSRRGKLPDGRAELYQRITETYLTSLDRARNLTFYGKEFNYDYLDLCDWLGKLALKLQESRNEKDQPLLINQQEVKKLLEKELKVRGMIDNQIHQEIQFILDYIEQRSGLFIRKGKNSDNQEQYGFTHLSFLEFFAAFSLKQEAEINSNFFRKKKTTTHFIWWHECWTLFFEQIEHHRLAEKYLNKLFDNKKGHSNTDILLAKIVMDSGVRLTILFRNEKIIDLWKDYLLNIDIDYEANIEKYVDLFDLIWTNKYKSLEIFNEQTRILNVNQLIIQGKAINNLSPLKGLTQLTYLELNNTSVTNLSALAELTQLTHLELNNTSVTNLSALAELTQLTHLKLNNTSVTNLSALAELTQLTHLELNNTPITDLSALAELTKLTHLELNNTSITDFSPLTQLTQITYLDLSHTSITDLSILVEHTQLTFLALNNTPITDLSPLANLTQISHLWLNDTHITDVKPLLGLKKLIFIFFGDISPNISRLKELTNIKPKITILAWFK